MLLRRVIPCLEVAGGRVVKGRRFGDWRDAGDPAELAARYAAAGADEIVLLDITAAPEGRATLLELVERTARRLFVPLTVGGGVRSTAGVRAGRRRGAARGPAGGGGGAPPAPAAWVSRRGTPPAPSCRPARAAAGVPVRPVEE